MRRRGGNECIYRYSVLLFVFARLIAEGWVEEAELAGPGFDYSQEREISNKEKRAAYLSKGS
jgi:hypothetical protein